MMDQPEPGAILLQIAFDPVNHQSIDLELKVVRYIVEGGWSHINLVQVVSSSRAGLVGESLVWKRARQDAPGKYDELAGHSGLRNEGMVEMVCYWYDHPQEEEGVPGNAAGSRPFLSILMTPYIPTTLTDLPLPLPEDRALAAARQLLEVLKYLSTPTEEYEFVLHRDIKPSNILVEEGTGRVVLCDFGASVKVKKGEMHPSIAGDLQIRAPEMLRASPEKISYSSKMDMYSLGLLLAYILLGKDLYPRRIVDGRPDEKAQLETVKRALDEDPESNLQKLKALFLSENVHLKPATLDFVARLLAVNPEHRPTAQQALQLEAFLSSNPG